MRLWVSSLDCGMAILSGDVLALNNLETMIHPVGSTILVRLAGRTIGSGEVSDNNDFSIELPDEYSGELEVFLGMLNAAPTLVDYHGQDIHIALLYSNVNNFIA